MTSEGQFRANRENAKRSTGPRTEAGKRRSRMNALKHGSYLHHADSITAGLLDEDPNEVEDLCHAIIDDLAPSSTLQYTQAAQIAQQIINQQRVHGLTSHLAEGESVGTSLDELVGTVRHEHHVYEHLTWAVGTRDQPAAFELSYLHLAQVLHAKHSHLGIDPPMHDRDATDPLEADRAELLRIVKAVYGSLDKAFDKLWDRRDQLAPQAAAETRMVRGIEANRLLKTLEGATNLHNRVAVSIARDLKAYRELKSLEPDLNDGADGNDPARNEPNTPQVDVPESENSVPDPMSLIF